MSAASRQTLVTGASGFIGRHLVAHLLAQGIDVVAVPGPFGRCDAARGMRVLPGRDLAADVDWRDALVDVDRVIHLAGLAHGRSGADEARMQRVNRDGSLTLARAAQQAGVERFVFVSTVAVHGHRAERAIDESALCDGPGAYAQSKRDAEQALGALLEDRLCVLRPPLVHGPGAPGNPARLLALVERGVPLPLASVTNRRSSIGVSNLCDALLRCATHPDAGGERFLVADDPPLSTAELVRQLARRLGRPDRLWPLPPTLLRVGATLLGRRALVERLLDDLEINSGHIRRRLAWTPPRSQDEGLDAWVAGRSR